MAIFDLRLTPTLHSIHIILVVFLDHKPPGSTVGILLLLCVEAEEEEAEVIHTFFRLIYGRHLNFRFDNGHKLYVVRV